jgi:hypothetical protein
MEYLLISREKPVMFKWKAIELARRNGVKKFSNLKGGSLSLDFLLSVSFFSPGFAFLPMQVQFSVKKCVRQRNLRLVVEAFPDEKFWIVL